MSIFTPRGQSAPDEVEPTGYEFDVSDPMDLHGFNPWDRLQYFNC